MGSDSNRIEVQITANAQGLIDGFNKAVATVRESTAKMATSFVPLASSAASSFEGIAGSSHEAAESMEGDFSRTEARHAAHMLGMNRAVGGFVATLPGVGAALNMAFAPLALMELIEWGSKGVEKLVTLREASKKLAESQEAFETAANNAFNSLQEKLIEAEKKTDELAGDHIGALKKELELIDMASMKNLVASFEQVEKAADDVFAKLVSHWYSFGQGADGAKNALTEFGAAYKELLSEGTDTGNTQASNLLSGTLQTAYDVLEAQETIAANRKSGGGQTDESYAAEQVLKAHKASLAVTNDEIAAQKLIVEALGRQVMLQEVNNATKAATSKNATTEERNKAINSALAVSEARLKGIEQGNAATLEAEDRGADEALKLQDATIKQQVALAVEGGALKAAAELAALPKYIAAQESFTQAKLAALDKDHEAQLKANAEERTLLEQGNAGGKNNAKLVENANQKAAIEQKYQTYRTSIITAGKAAVMQLETEEATQRTELARQGVEARVALVEEESKRTESAARDGAAASIKQTQQNAQEELRAVEVSLQRGLISRQEAYNQKRGILEKEKADVDAVYDDEKSKLEGLIAAYQAQQATLSATDPEYKRLTADINQLQAAIAKAHVSEGEFGSKMDTDVKALNNDAKMMTTSWHQFFTKFQVDSKQATDTLRAGLQASITQMNAGLANAFSKSIVEGESFGQAMRQVTGQVLEGFVDMCVQMALQWAESQLMMAILGKSTQTTVAEGQIASEAAVGGAAAMASIAAIPIIGPELAPAAGASMYAGILGTFGPLAAFDNGGLVHQTGLVFAHQGEGVLTAPTTAMLKSVNALVNGSLFRAGTSVSAVQSAGTSRGLNSSSAVAGVSGGGASEIHIHFNGCFDAKTFWSQQQGNVISTVKDAIKNRRG